jgi:hypothetical protein
MQSFYSGCRKAAIDVWADQGRNPRIAGSDGQEKKAYDEVLPCTRLSVKRKAIDMADEGDAGLPA